MYFFSVAFLFLVVLICFSLFLLESNIVVSQLSLFNVVTKKDLKWCPRGVATSVAWSCPVLKTAVGKF